MEKLPNPIDKRIGSRVRMQRNLVGISQTKLAEALGVTFQQVQKYENGANRISASRLPEIARILRVSPTYFFEGIPGQGDDPNWSSGGRGETLSSESVLDFVSSREGLLLNRAFAMIDDAKSRKKIVDLVVAIAGAENF
jgi:transcriptional regulator with XRE-family HTH domain